MIATRAVGKDKRLLGDIYPVNKIQVDDEPASKANEVGTIGPQLFANQFLYLPQLEGDDAPPAILGDHFRVIPLG